MDVPPASTGPILVTRDLTVRFRVNRSDLVAVDGLSYELHPGKTLAVVGQSGAGKTVACRALLGLLPPNASVSGSARLAGAELIGLNERQMRRHRGSDIAMVFQDPDRALNPIMSIGRQIAEAVRVHERCDRHRAGERAVELLKLLRVGAPNERFHAFPHELSGGMRQRVMIALAIAGRPKVLVADEATRSLDVTTQAAILKLLKNLQAEFGMAIIMVCHDLRLAALWSDDVLVMRAARAVEYASASRLFRTPESKYARALLEAVPSGGASNRLVGQANRRPLLIVRDIVQRFRIRGAGLPGFSEQRTVHAVNGVSFEIGIGETLGLVGETGAGKSALAMTLFQTPPPVSGAVSFAGAELGRLRGRALIEHRRRMQMVFQDPYTSLNPAWRVSSIVAEPLAGFRIGRLAERRRKVAEALEFVDLPFTVYGNRLPRELSGGECQRVAIARALVSDPALIVCDEALSSLDVLIQAQILALLERLRNERGLSYLFISHDLAQVARIADRVAVMYQGRFCEVGPASAILRRPQHPYTAALVASLPSDNAQ